MSEQRERVARWLTVRHHGRQSLSKEVEPCLVCYEDADELLTLLAHEGEPNIERIAIALDYMGVGSRNVLDAWDGRGKGGLSDRDMMWNLPPESNLALSDSLKDDFRKAARKVLEEFGLYLHALPVEPKECPPHGPWLESAEAPGTQCQKCGRWFTDASPGEREPEEREREAYRAITDDERRELRLAETKLKFPQTSIKGRDLENLPNILRLGAGAESSLATQMMRAAADEIDRLRASPDTSPQPESREREALGLLKRWVTAFGAHVSKEAGTLTGLTHAILDGRQEGEKRDD